MIPLLLAVAIVGGCSPERRATTSVLLVTLDTTRADRLGAYGAAPDRTPHLDALAARGLVFENAFAVAPLTLPAHATLMTGLLPHRTGVRWNGEHRLGTEAATLAERFAANGFETGAFVSAAVLDSQFGLDRGFEIYDDEVGVGGAFKAERAGMETARRALAWLDARAAARPVFLWVHLFEPHDPYTPPADFAARFPGDPYAGEVAAVDAAVAPLLEHRRFSFSDGGIGGIVAVVGDHGESLGEKGEATHGVLVHDAVLRIAWIVVAPGVGARRMASEASQADLAPTLLALAGLAPLGGIDGDPLVDHAGQPLPPRARTLYAESLYGEHVYGWAPLRAARRGGWKLVRGARDELFETGSDPLEETDRLGEAPADAAALSSFLGETAAKARTAATADVDGALRDQLSSLGYLAGTGDASTPTPPVSVDPRDRIGVHEKLRQLESALERGASDAAERLREILAEDPGNRFARRAADAERRASDAERRASEASRVELAALALAERRFAEAERWARAAVALAPGSSAARNALAIALEEQGRIAEAEREYTTVLAADPNYARAELNLALLRGERGAPGDRKLAVAGLERVLARSPREPLALWALGRIAASAGDPARAADLLARFLAVAPDHPRAAEARKLIAALGT